MGEMAKQYDRILSVCHALRYSPFFSKIKSLLDEKKIGRLITIQHIEEIGYWYYAQSFVRGNWRNAEEARIKGIVIDFAQYRKSKVVEEI